LTVVDLLVIDFLYVTFSDQSSLQSAVFSKWERGFYGYREIWIPTSG